ncbi:hypothetical protein HK100_006561 [Physocladia obscura]|uniref:Cyclin N-terminal domain-containing protein n=1 Tax=Physocladia obscura TaxID=109957 RepID=A0AAD5SRP0_9FUNG|nr:hypothetical protein HK100_006561 [Physocladia obscura]
MAPRTSSSSSSTGASVKYTAYTASAAHVALVVQAAANVIKCPPTSTSTTTIPPLAQFVALVASRARSTPETLLITTALLDRARRRLPSSARGLPCTAHRLFLAALVVAAKSANDKTYKNKSFVSFADGLFPLSEINLMERQLLGILDYDVSFSVADFDATCARLHEVEGAIAALPVSSAMPIAVPVPRTSLSLAPPSPLESPTDSAGQSVGHLHPASPTSTGNNNNLSVSARSTSAASISTPNNANSSGGRHMMPSFLNFITSPVSRAASPVSNPATSYGSSAGVSYMARFSAHFATSTESSNNNQKDKERLRRLNHAVSTSSLL